MKEEADQQLRVRRGSLKKEDGYEIVIWRKGMTALGTGIAWRESQGCVLMNLKTSQQGNHQNSIRRNYLKYLKTRHSLQHYLQS